MKQHTFAECNKWREQNDIEVSDEVARLMIKKLARHFKLPIRYVYFRQCVTSTAYRFGRRIKLWHNPSVRIICHEVCHFLCWKKFDKRVQHGSKKWYSQMKILINYAKKKNYWKEEFERRTTPKRPKLEPTPREIRIKKIQRLEEGIKRHQTKVKRCQTLIKKNNRRISALKRFL